MQAARYLTRENEGEFTEKTETNCTDSSWGNLRRMWTMWHSPRNSFYESLSMRKSENTMHTKVAGPAGHCNNLLAATSQFHTTGEALHVNGVAGVLVTGRLLIIMADVLLAVDRVGSSTRSRCLCFAAAGSTT